MRQNAGTQLIRKRRINSWRSSIASFGLRRLNTFSRRSGSIAAGLRTSLSRVLHFAYGAMNCRVLPFWIYGKMLILKVLRDALGLFHFDLFGCGI